MKLSTQAIGVFEKLAMNAHHAIEINTLLADQSQAVKEIFSLRDSTNVRNQFGTTGYFPDSVKVTAM
jgi:hypothetical protein